MNTVYRVKDWDALYENAESRKTKRLNWVAVPNRHDGKGYRRVLKHPDAPEVFCAWVLILQVASRCPSRGILVDSDGPIGAEDLSDKTGFPAAMFEKALKALCDPKIGWIEQVDASRIIPPHPDASGHAGTEQNGTEQKGREENGARAPRRNGKPRRPKKPVASGPHAELIAHFAAGWRARNGSDYTFQGEKDGTAAKRVLETCRGDVGAAKRLVDLYLADDDTWVTQRGHGLSFLPGQLNRLRAGNGHSSSAGNGDTWEPRDPTQEDLDLIRQPIAGET